MAISFEAPHDVTPVAVDELMDAAAKAYKGDSIDAMQAVADKLQKLGANREFIQGALLAELRRMAGDNGLSMYAPQSMIIHRAPPFSVRLNLWVPLAGSARKVNQESRVFSYDKAHDHNFSLLTVGVTGPGYGTRIYEYDSNAIVGYDGEHVDMTFLEETKLPEGKAMIYRPRRDIHIQIPPEAPSMSLNLLIEEKNLLAEPQYFFDTTTNSLSLLYENEVGRRVSFLRAIGHFADEECATLLFDVARQNSSPSVRAAALRAIGIGFPENQREIDKLAKADGHPLVARESHTADKERLRA